MTRQPGSAKLQATWMLLMAELAVEQNRGRDAYSDLARRYDESQRVYHTLVHVWQVVQNVRRLAPYAQNLAQVQTAAWLHDVIYDPRAAGNEERSAAYAAQLLQALEQPHSFIAGVQRLILLTKEHKAAPEDGDGCVLLDADLAILGARPAAYTRYAGAIRREYAWAPEETYRSGRVAVLRQLLQRPFIYHTVPMRQEREQVARENIQAEIKSLSFEGDASERDASERDASGTG